MICPLISQLVAQIHPGALLLEEHGTGSRSTQSASIPGAWKGAIDHGTQFVYHSGPFTTARNGVTCMDQHLKHRK